MFEELQHQSWIYSERRNALLHFINKIDKK